MNKMAIFVEGLTEQLFVEKLLINIVGQKNIHITKKKLTGGKKYPRKRIHLSQKDNENKYFVVIANCCSDSTVTSDIRDNYESLVKEGFSSIIGIRDVYPVNRADIPRLKLGLGKYIKTKPIVPVLVLSIMEVEAWFLAEYTHFEKIHKDLTPERIKSELKFNPVTDDMELRDRPANDLNNVYRLNGLAYKKEESYIRRTIKALDFAKVYLDLSPKFKPLTEMISEIDRFIEL